MNNHITITLKEDTLRTVIETLDMDSQSKAFSAELREEIADAVQEIESAERLDFDNSYAFSEGWALFDDGEIQRLDEGPWKDGEPTMTPCFDTDEQAIEHVIKLALAGSAYHQAALNKHTTRSKPSKQD